MKKQLLFTLVTLFSLECSAMSQADAVINTLRSLYNEISTAKLGNDLTLGNRLTTTITYCADYAIENSINFLRMKDKNLINMAQDIKIIGKELGKTYLFMTLEIDDLYEKKSLRDQYRNKLGNIGKLVESVRTRIMAHKHTTPSKQIAQKVLLEIVHHLGFMISAIAYKLANIT